MNLSFHKEVVADEGQASWEGLYFIGEDKIYFELVKENEKMGILPESIGLALSHLPVENFSNSIDILSQIVDTNRVGEILEVSFPDQRMSLKFSPSQSQNELDIETLDGKLVILTF